MPVLDQLTAVLDGTINTTNLSHDAGIGFPFYTHCNDAPDGGSSDYVQVNTGSDTGVYQAWFKLSSVNTNFIEMSTLNIDVDVLASAGITDDTCDLTARIFDADNDTSNPLTAESGVLADETDTTRTQRNVAFSTLSGTKTDWNAAYIRFTWTYTRVSGPDLGSVRLYGFDIDGVYNGATTQLALSATPGRRYDIYDKDIAGGGFLPAWGVRPSRILSGSSF